MAQEGAGQKEHDGYDHVAYFINFMKLRALELTEYEKILLLDTDTHVSKNVDHWFELSAPAGIL